MKALGLIAGLLLVASEASAEYAVTREAYEYLEKAHDLIKKEKLTAAEGLLLKMQRRLDLNDHEQALAYQALGHVYAGQEDYEKAAKVFEQCLRLGSLPEDLEISVHYNLGQLHLAGGRVEKAIATFDKWLGVVEKPSSGSIATIASANYQAKKYRRAAELMQWGVSQSKRPQTSWLQLLLSAYYETKQHRRATRVLQQLVERQPNQQSHWLQLSALYSELGNEKKALAVLDMAYRAGHLDKHQHYLNLAQRYLHQGIPRKAADVLQRGMDEGIVEKDAATWKLLGTAWSYAREPDMAIRPYTRAAKLTKDGDLHIQIAQLHVERERWDDAIKSAKRALTRKKLKNKGQAYLLIAIAEKEAGRLNNAKKAVRKASTYAATRRSAKSWMAFLEGR